MRSRQADPKTPGSGPGGSLPRARPSRASLPLALAECGRPVPALACVSVPHSFLLGRRGDILQAPALAAPTLSPRRRKTKMKILVTGSSGLIGSEVVDYFCRLRWEVHGVDNNMRADFFGAGGDTRWNQRRLA